MQRAGADGIRARGAKCDLSNPECQRFSSTNWSSNRALQRYSRPKTRQNREPPAAHGIENIPRLDSTWTGTVRERQSLHFFSVVSAPELSGFLDSHFWQRVLLQATHLDHGIRHAVVAIGACHEHQLRMQVSRINGETEALPSFALRQCNKAITVLLREGRQLSPQDLLRALTASVLFTCFESVKQNRAAAVPHVLHSRRLIEQYKKQLRCNASHSQESAFPVGLDIIEPLVTHYETQVRAYQLSDGSEDPMYGGVEGPMLEFDKLKDARISLESLIADFTVALLRFEHCQTPEDISALERVKSKYSDTFQLWSQGFIAFLGRECHRMDRDTLDGCRVLQAHHLLSCAFSRVSYGEGDEAWSEFTLQFQLIVELLSEVIENLPKRPGASPPPQVAYLNTNMGMTEPLYCAATGCADGAIAAKAKKLLAKLPLSESYHSAWKIDFIERLSSATTGCKWSAKISKHFVG